MDCPICKKYIEKKVRHNGEECPVRSTFWCSQCSCKGHLPADCDEVKHVWRPESLEEIIRTLGGQEVLDRWGITTETRIAFKRPLTLEDAEREIANTNTIDVVYRIGKKEGSRVGTMDSAVRDVIRSLTCQCCPKLVTVHKTEGCIQMLRVWAVAHGKKVRLVQEK